MNAETITRDEFCNCCHQEQFSIQKYFIENDILKSCLQKSSISLCNYCKRLAEHVEQFIQNVNNANKLFNKVDVVKKSTLSNAINNIVLPFRLTICNQKEIECINDSDEKFIVYSYEPRVMIKIELKKEFTTTEDDTGFISNDDINDLDYEVKEELEIKKEKSDEDFLVKLKKARRKTEKNDDAKTKVRASQRKDTDKVDIVYISMEECTKERLLASKCERYLDSPLKCENCLKGFITRNTFEKHMEKHAENSGQYECDICRQRMKSYEQLIYHKKYHFVRYKCKECSIMRNCRRSILEHYNTKHISDNSALYPCHKCSKTYKCNITYMKHVRYAHKNNKRVVCDFCQKSYANKEVLRSHLLNIHTADGIDCIRKRYNCEVCEKSFVAPSLLKKHMLKHSDRKDFYCVECDKSFKSDSCLKQHLKNTTQHAHYAELPYPCQHCEKRFSIKRDVERHMNSVHLNIKPFQCDKCDRAYVSKWSLTDHIRMIHEGYKPPMKFPCPFCDKVFGRGHILKSHIRTHTGERPYQCSKCPASFSQLSVMKTHVKLIHLKQTRDGRAKPQRSI